MKTSRPKLAQNLLGLELTFDDSYFRPLKAKLLDSESAVLALGQNQIYPSHYWVQTAGLGSSNRASTYKFANIPTSLPI